MRCDGLRDAPTDGLGLGSIEEAISKNRNGDRAHGNAPLGALPPAPLDEQAQHKNGEEPSGLRATQKVRTPPKREGRHIAKGTA